MKHIPVAQLSSELNRNVAAHVIATNEHDTMRLYILISELVLLSIIISSVEAMKNAS